MQQPLQISFRHMPRSPVIDSIVRTKAAKLDTFANDILGCRVVVEPAGEHHLYGNLYQVHLRITLPGREIVVSREPSQHLAYKEIAVAVRDAFDSARRRLQDYTRRRRRAVKTHGTQPRARVSKIVSDKDHGFLVTADGRDLYFHRNSVLGAAFDRLAVGSEVSFVEERGSQGPQASTVRPIGRRARLRRSA